MNKDILTRLAQSHNYTQHDADTYQAGATDYINAVFHGKDEKPDKDKWCLVEAKYVGIDKPCYHLAISYEVFPYPAVRWAYVEDLLPERKEEQK